MYYQNLRLTPYLGAGYRYLFNEGSGRRTTTGHFGYDREANYYYSPIGVAIQSRRNPCITQWLYGAKFEYD